jgi:hypothetical protein
MARAAAHTALGTAVVPLPDDTDDAEPTCEGQQLPGDAPPPPPVQYQGQTVNPVFDSNLQQWGFWSQKKWVPLHEPAC